MLFVTVTDVKRNKVTLWQKWRCRHRFLGHGQI